MKLRHSLAFMAAAALVVSTAVQANAAPANSYTQTFSFHGKVAEAHWASDAEPVAGSPWLVAVMAYKNARATSHVTGSRPTTEPVGPLVAMAMLQSAQPGAEPTPVEYWCLGDHADFRITGNLTAASLRMTCDAEVFTIDDEGNEVPTGETVPWEVTAAWRGVGDLVRERGHVKTTDEAGWTIDRLNASTRMASAVLTVTGPDGVVFDGAMDRAGLSKVSAGSLQHSTVPMPPPPVEP